MKNQAVIAYDIVENKTRQRVFRCLRTWQLHSQYSVFECHLTSRQSNELLLQLCGMIDESQDKLLFAWLDMRRPAKPLTKRAAINFQKPVWYVG